MKSLKKKIVAGLMVAMCFAPCFSENICESAEGDSFSSRQTDVKNSSEVYELLLNVFAAQRKLDFQTAITYADQGVERYPDIAYFYYLRAGLFKYPKINKQNEIVQNLDKAIKLDPNFADAYLLRAEIFAKDKEYEKALEDCNRAIELEPGRIYSYRIRANIYKLRGENDKFFEDCSKVIELEPDYATGEYFERANYYYSQGKYDDVILDCNNLIVGCEKAIAAKSKNNKSEKDGKGKKADVNMSDLMSALFPGQAETAARAFDVVSKMMILPNAYVLRGKAYYEQGKYKEAIEDGKKALSLERTAMGAQRLIDLSERALKNN